MNVARRKVGHVARRGCAQADQVGLEDGQLYSMVHGIGNSHGRKLEGLI